jgi:tetratricopeptide (TPR) repeat protein
VIGTVVPLPLLAACCDEQPSPAVIMRLADADFLYPHGDAGQCLRFKHGITRDAVYNSIGLFERTEMHRRIETSLLARQGGSSEAEDSEALAYHAAGAGHWSLASKAAEQAGDRASAAHAMDSARRQYRASLDALDRLPARDDAADARWCALAAKLAFACVFDPLSLPDGLAIFERAVQLARLRRDARALAHAIYWLGYLLYSVGRFREAAEPLQEALDIAHEVGDNRLAAQLQATLGQALAGAGDYSRAIGLMDAALDHKRAARRPRGGFAVGSAYTLGCLAYVHADQGDFARAQQAFDEALGLLGDSSHPVVTSTRNWLAIALLWQGRWAEARLVAEESVRVATGTRALLLLACSRAVLGFARWNLGEPAGVEQLREAVRWMSARHCDFYASLFNGWLAEAAAASGDDEALHAALRVVRQRSRAGERLGEAALWRAFALRAHFSGRTAAARRWLRRAGRTGAQRGSLREAALNALLQAVFESDAGGLEQAHASIGELGIAALPQPYAGLIPRAAS